MPVSKDGILRFPRYDLDTTNQGGSQKKQGGLSRLEKYELRTASGDLPLGYDRLTKKQKKLAKYIASGISIGDACRLAKCARETLFRWRRAHPLFREYLRKTCLKYAQRVDERLEGQLPRAVQIVEDAMSSGDPYFEYEVSKDLLKGKGKYKSSIQSQQQVSGAINVTGKHDVTTHGMDREMLLMFVNALVGKAQETKDIKTIDVKALPESTEETKEE
jgi:hypothetical protein